jgi:hypothetical protein
MEVGSKFKLQNIVIANVQLKWRRNLFMEMRPRCPENMQFVISLLCCVLYLSHPHHFC